jgi:hypothetical protein
MDAPFDRKRKRLGRKDFIAKAGITQVAPEMIAYAALQVSLPIHLLSILIASSTDILRTVIHAIMEGYGWLVQPHPPLPYYREDTFKPFRSLGH